MKDSITTDWNVKQALLKETILKPEQFEQTRQLLFEMHSLVHTCSVYNVEESTILDAIWNGLDEKTFRTMPTTKDVTIAWNLWHITRIEDLTANILIANGRQVLDEEWLAKLNTTVKDTGNAMTDDEIISFSNEVSMNALFEYRAAVGIRTKAIIGSLQHGDMKRKISMEQTGRILAEGGVTPHKDSIWLLDFWGRKTVAGIMLMPITRHQIVHLNDCRNLRKRLNK
jgi:hypothetical protein